MGFGPKVCLASELTLKVLKEGKPVHGAEVVRKYRKSYSDDEPRQQRGVVDNNGMVTMPAIFERSFHKYFPIESHIRQIVEVIYEGEKKEVLSIYKTNLDEWGELNNATAISSGLEDFKPNKYICELNNEAESRLVNRHGHAKFHGVCQHVSELT